MVEFGTILLNSLMTTHVKGLQQNEGITEIDMSHCDRKWNYRAHSKESVAAYARKQRRQKTNKDDMNITDIHILFSLALAVLMYKQVTHPYLSCKCCSH